MFFIALQTSRQVNSSERVELLEVVENFIVVGVMQMQLFQYTQRFIYVNWRICLTQFIKVVLSFIQKVFVRRDEIQLLSHR